jgi:hypothetical protein
LQRCDREQERRNRANKTVRLRWKATQFETPN